MAVAAGRTVKLYKNGVYVTEAVTDGSGLCSFPNLTPASDYSVLIMLPTDTSEFTYTFGNVTITDPAGTASTQGTYGNTVHVVAPSVGVSGISTVTFNYNKNVVPV